MAEWGERERPVPDGWPARPDRTLALNLMGTFDWDLERGLMYMDPRALEVFGLTPEEYDGRAGSLSPRLPKTESATLDAAVTHAMNSGAETYGAYFRSYRVDGALRWAHTQGAIRRDEDGRPIRVIGIVRDATLELAESAARLTQDEERRRQTSVIQATTAALAHARTVQDVIDLLKNSEGLPHLGTASMVVGLVEGNRIKLVAEGQVGSFVPGTEFTRLDQPYPMSEVIRTLVPRYIESREDFATSFPLLWPYIDHLEISCAAYLPLVAQGRPIGAIGLLYRDKTGFTAEDRNILVALGSSIAQSLARAMLYEQDKDLAENLQQAMLPRRIPEIPGGVLAVRYRAAKSGHIGRDIGGDWYDVIPLPGGRVGAVIGDVQGHDSHAAAVMGQLRIVLRAYAVEGHDPATVMVRASSFLHDLDTDRFATCTYAEVDIAEQTVRVVRAGHLHPLLRDADGRCTPMTVEGGLPLGLSAEFGRLEHPVTEARFGPGQTLVLCTDGLVEEPGSDLDEGFEALARQITTGPADLEDLADALCEDAEGRDGADDMALLLLRSGGAVHLDPVRRKVDPGDAEGLHEARQLIRATAERWGLAARADEIVLVADELIVNTLTHAGSPAHITLRIPVSGGLRVEVEDASDMVPQLREAGEDGVSGRGMFLVGELADTWGVESRGAGKCVWCVFGLPAA